MNNADKPAMPCEWKDFDSQGIQVVRESYSGMTKREYFAGFALQGIMANPNAAPIQNYHFTHIAQDAIKIADTLLLELEKEPKK